MSTDYQVFASSSFVNNRSDICVWTVLVNIFWKKQNVFAAIRLTNKVIVLFWFGQYIVLTLLNSISERYTNVIAAIVLEGMGHG